MKKLIAIFFLSLFSFSLSAACNKVDELDIAAWSYKVMMALFPYDYSYAESKIDRRSAFFTEDAWSNLSKNIEKTGVINKIKEQRLNLSVGLYDTPIVFFKDNKWIIVVTPLIHYDSTAFINAPRIFPALATLTVIQDKQCEFKIKNLGFRTKLSKPLVGFASFLLKLSNKAQIAIDKAGKINKELDSGSALEKLRKLQE